MAALMDRLAKYAASDAKVLQELLDSNSFDRFQGGLGRGGGGFRRGGGMRRGALIGSVGGGWWWVG
jgi:hypothetical protein